MNPLQMNILFPLYSAIVMDAEGDGYLILFFLQHIRSYEKSLKNGTKSIKIIYIQLFKNKKDTTVKPEENYAIQNSMNRLANVIYDDGSTIDYTYTLTGKIDTITDSSGLMAYSYDNRNRLIQVTYPDGKIISYTYDANGNKVSVTENDGGTLRTTTYIYDALNRLDTVTDNDGGVTSYFYDAVGNKVGVNHPNGTTTEYQYDMFNRLTYLENRETLSGTVLSSYTYTLDSNGNRIQVIEDTGKTVDYTYELNRLVEENIDNGTSVTTYTYDSVGNRTQMVQDGIITDYTYANDQLLTETTSGNTTIYTYDLNGNNISKTDISGTTSYIYNARDRLKTVTLPDGSVITYAYDAQNNRIQKDVNGTAINYLIDSNRKFPDVVAEYDDTGSLIVDYTYGDTRIKFSRNGEYYYFYDGLGSVRGLSDSTGAVVNSYDYSAYGNLLSSTVTVPNDYLFTGQNFDFSINQYYLRARNYDPAIGRFTSRDPHTGSIYLPISLHPYQYADLNPVINTDPSGEFTIAGTMNTMAVMSILTAIALPRIDALTRPTPTYYETFYHGTDSVSAALIVGGGPMLSLGASKRGSVGFYTVKEVDIKYAKFLAGVRADDTANADPAIVKMKLDSKLYEQFFVQGSVTVNQNQDMFRGNIFRFTEYTFLPQTFYLLHPPRAIFSYSIVP